MQRKVKVMDMPLTYILVDSPLSDEEIRERWLKKYQYRHSLSEEQIRRETTSVREGKLTQIRKYKH